MTSIPYTTKAGLKQFRPKCSSAEVEEGDNGFCLACGTEAHGVEPDARKYECEGCGAPKVYGLEELCMMGLAKLTDSEGDEEDE